MRLTPEPVIDDQRSRTEFMEYPFKCFQPERFYDRRARISVVFNTRSKLVPAAVKTAPKFCIVCCICAAKMACRESQTQRERCDAGHANQVSAPHCLG
jgi:hypothetical protein